MLIDIQHIPVQQVEKYEETPGVRNKVKSSGPGTLKKGGKLSIYQEFQKLSNVTFFLDCCVRCSQSQKCPQFQKGSLVGWGAVDCQGNHGEIYSHTEKIIVYRTVWDV